MIKIDTPLKLVEPLPGYLFAGSPTPVVCPTYKELTLRGFDVRLQTGGREYELSTTDAPNGDGFCMRALAVAGRVVRLAPGMLLEQRIVLPNAGYAVGISWRLLGNKIRPVRLTATPSFSSAEPISSAIFAFDAEHNGGRLTWLPFRGGGKIIADTNGNCTEPPVAIGSHRHENTVAPSAFVFDLGRRPALLLLSVEPRTSRPMDPLVGEFLALVADPRQQDPDLTTADQGLATVLQQLKSNSSRIRRPHSESAFAYQIDEALWAAYRRYDKGAVTEKLLRWTQRKSLRAQEV